MTTPTATGEQEWHQLDAAGQVLGRLASRTASLLLGKHLPKATRRTVPNVFVVIANTDQVMLTGRKETDKIYYRNTGYPGGIRQRTVREQRERDSRRIVADAVSGMLPRNNLRRDRLRHLRLHRGEAPASSAKMV